MSGGLTEDRVLRVQGLASSTPFDRNDPASPANRRISIIVMNREAEERVLRPRIDPAAAQAEAGVPPPSSPPAPGR